MERHNENETKNEQKISKEKYVIISNSSRVGTTAATTTKEGMCINREVYFMRLRINIFIVQKLFKDNKFQTRICLLKLRGRESKTSQPFFIGK